MNTYLTTSAAYLSILEDVYLRPDYRVSPRGLPAREKVDYLFKILAPTAEPIITMDPERNQVIQDYTAKEMTLYRSGTNRVEDFARASKFWTKIANPDGTINSAYGFLIWKNQSCGNPQFEKIMRTPWEWSKQSLIRDKDTRQAIMRFSLPEHQWFSNLDQTCTLTGNWSIREDKLNLMIVMRSTDMVKGLVFDIPFFVSLLDQMLEELRETYPSLGKGTYTHLSHSIHIYESDDAKVRRMLGI